MTRLSTTTAARGALLAVAALLAAGPAQAAPRTADSGDYLYLTVTRGDGASGDTGSTHNALLLCDPPQGYARAAEACAELGTVGGDIARLAPAEGAVCPMVYAPVTAQARGQWNGRPIEYRETYANACVLAARTGPVFTLD
ncbi:SSI family serine proteinase inhibitor [Streptomyces humi]|uniref:SSI family serine proteinase inhibitor n=1 Tax=Streptomyces humi TaxID=1428620 RepID=UPI0006287C6B|nr:SSI family serine proteinase inhibitor [Streptomyces humi]